jgi:hypothetical protein
MPTPQQPSTPHMKKIHKQDYFELAVFLMHYHSGQWSRGYRILCKLNVHNISSSCERECEETEIYQYLVNNYAKTV